MILTNDNFKSGFVSIIGRPNVGKSTFLNKVIGSKIAIMSNKPQTTRNKILGIYTDEESQIIFIDTPGIHKPVKELGNRLNDAAYSSFKESDIILFMVAADEELGTGDKMIIEKLKNVKAQVYLLINKVDLLENKDDIKEIILSYATQYNFKEVFPISAKEGNNIDKLISNLKENLDFGPKYYPDDMLTDHPERFIISEFIREKCIELTTEEVPHSIACIIDSIKDMEDYIEIYATIYVERKSQKGIIIGKDGKLMKEIKRRAKKDIKKLLGTDIDLNLWVKIKKDWTERPQSLEELGYEKDTY